MSFSFGHFVVAVRPPAGVHFGTRFVFDKGYLYFVIGERGGLMEVQDLSRPNGKIHRLFDLSADKILALDRSWDASKGTPVFTVKKHRSLS